MSAASSIHQLESPTVEGGDPLENLPKDQEEREHQTLAKLIAISPHSQHVIAIDLDDVLSQTNQTVAECKLYLLNV